MDLFHFPSFLFLHVQNKPEKHQNTVKKLIVLFLYYYYIYEAYKNSGGTSLIRFNLKDMLYLHIVHVSFLESQPQVHVI